MSGAPEPYITPQMIEAGEQAILEQVGGAELGASFSAPGLAVEVYLAMDGLRPSGRVAGRLCNPAGPRSNPGTIENLPKVLR